MTVVVEVGPDRVRGAGTVAPEAAVAALEGIDDELTLVGDTVRPVDELWCEVMTSAIGGAATGVVLVTPGSWPSRSVDRVRDAALTVVDEVTVTTRPEALARGVSGDCAVVEVAADAVVVTRACRVVAAIPRTGEDAPVVTAVAAAVGHSAVVIVDATTPAGVADRIAERLRGTGRTVITERGLPDPVEEPAVCAEPAAKRRLRTVAVPAGIAAAVVAVLVGRAPDAQTGFEEMPSALLVEGRVAVRVPATWPVRRISDGPGSARVQIDSPDDGAAALLVTQSAVPTGETQETAATALRDLLDAQPPGVFVDFDPSDRRSGRSVSTYREVRADHHVRWAVFIDGAVRIAIGCQAAPDREQAVERACDAAIASAHALF